MNHKNSINEQIEVFRELQKTTMELHRARQKIAGLPDVTVSEVEAEAMDYARCALVNAGIYDVEVVAARVYGSRAHDGESHPLSDLDIVLEYKGGIREDDFFSLLHDESEPLVIGGIPVDMNPITEDKTGTLAEFMAREAQLHPLYLREKQLRLAAGAENNPLWAAEMSAEQNCNQIDGIINNEAPRPSIREQLRETVCESVQPKKDTQQNSLER